jgi:hypothetical protein
MGQGGINMGMGALASANAIFKRKYRWTFELNTPCGRIPETIVKVAARPNINIEETEINYLHGKMWIPGKASWETITVTYYDVVADQSSSITNLYNWLSTVYEFHNPERLHQSSKKGGAGAAPAGIGAQGYAGQGVLKLYDGSGVTMETWTLGHVWPQAINFGDLDYSSSEEVNVELTLRYSEVRYESGNCGPKFKECGTSGCT